MCYKSYMDTHNMYARKNYRLKKKKPKKKQPLDGEHAFRTTLLTISANVFVLDTPKYINSNICDIVTIFPGLFYIIIVVNFPLSALFIVERHSVLFLTIPCEN